MGFLCELLGLGSKSTTHERQLRPARDPPEFKPGLLADTGILWVQFFRKLLIPKNIAADYTKELGPLDCAAVRRQRREERRGKKCKYHAKYPKKEEPKLVDAGLCKEFRESVNAAPIELKAESFDTKTDSPPKCGNRPATSTIYCDKCHACTRVVDCTGHKKPENK